MGVTMSDSDHSGDVEPLGSIEESQGECEVPTATRTVAAGSKKLLPIPGPKRRNSKRRHRFMIGELKPKRLTHVRISYLNG